MNQCLENPPAEEMGSGREAPIPGDAVEALVAIGATDERRTPAPIAVVPEKGRVLILEDDVSFREIICDYLSENGYMVVAVQNGGDGVREVLGGDFTMVLCDLMMPVLPGDMFFRAVEKIRPELCKGFIFMTGHQCDVRTNEFIKSVDGFVLRKPFPLKNLLDTIVLADVRRTCTSVFDDVAPSEPEVSRHSQSGDRLRASGTPLRQTSDAIEYLAPARHFAPFLPVPASETNVPTPDVPSVELPANGRKFNPEGVSRLIVLVGLGLLLILVFGLWSQDRNARNRVAAATAELATQEAKWSTFSRALQQATALRSKLDLDRSEWEWISAERAKPRFFPLLRDIVPSLNESIEILGIAARGETEDSTVDEMRIHGIASGSQPRLRADRYRQTLEDDLRRSASGRPVTTRFEKLEDADAAQGRPRVDFLVIVSLGATNPAANIVKEAR